MNTRFNILLLILFCCYFNCLSPQSEVESNNALESVLQNDSDLLSVADSDEATNLDTIDTIDDDEIDASQAEQIDQKPSLMKTIPKSLRPRTATDDPDDKIEVYFDNVDLLNVLDWVQQTFAVIFISGDILTPKNADTKVSDAKITFKTQYPITKQAMWDLFLAFLDLADRSLLPMAYTENYPTEFKVVNANKDKSGPFPLFIGTDWQTLPDSDTKIRYIYFVENSTVEILTPLATNLSSKNAFITNYPAQKALIMTDKASNIRSLMQIIKELDTVAMPEMMQVIKLKHADVDEVKTIWDMITKAEQKQGTIEARLFPAKKLPTAIYFPEDLRIIPNRAMNALIVLGTQEGIKKFEDFIAKHIDTDIKVPHSPLYIYPLQFISAKDTANILNEVLKFESGSAAATYGGVRDGDKYFRPGINITAEEAGNRLLIRAEKDDYIKLERILKTLDIQQPQIAIEVMIVEISDLHSKQLGSQIRNKQPNTFTNNIDFQTSGFPNRSTGVIVNNGTPPITNRSAGSLLGNLISLAVGQPIGSTILSIGNDLTGGIWAIFKVLETTVNANLISHPFLVTTNGYAAKVSVGQTRRVQTATVTGAGGQVSAQDDIKANLTVALTPRINSNGIITLEIQLNIESFEQADNFTSAAVNAKEIKTTAYVANKEVLALGGLVKNTVVDRTSKVPILGDVPLFGWFFKNKIKENNKTNLLVFISPQIIEPRLQGGLGTYSEKKTQFTKQLICDMRHPVERRDPIHRWFFKDTVEEQTHYVDDFVTKKYHGEHRDVMESSFYNSPCGDTINCASHTAPNIPRNDTPKDHTLLVNNKAKRSIANYMPDSEKDVICS